MQLTYDNIHALFNLGCPNTPQAIALGLEMPLQKGWIQRLIGRDIEQAEYDRLLSLKGPRPKGVATADWKARRIQPKPKPAKDITPELFHKEVD